MQTRGSFTLRLLAEMVSVVFAVLLALIANEWRQAVHTQKRVNVALQNIRAEATENINSLRTTSAIQQTYLDSLRATFTRPSRRRRANQPFAQVYLELQSKIGQGLLVPNVNTSSWRSAVSTGLISEFRYPVVLKLSDIQSAVDILERRVARLESTMYSSEFLQAKAARVVTGEIMFMLNDLLDVEHRLLNHYSALLELIPA